MDQAAFDARKANFCAALDTELYTSLSVTAIYDVLKADTTPATKLALIEDFDYVLGLDLVKAAKQALAEEQAAAAAEDSDPFVREIKEKIAERIAAKKAKDYALADAIRNELLEKGVTLIDTRDGTDFKIEK